MKKEYYLILEKRRDFFLKELYDTLKDMYAVPGGWDAGWVARLNDRIFEYNLFVKQYNPTQKEAQQLYIKIVLLGSNS